MYRAEAQGSRVFILISIQVIYNGRRYGCTPKLLTTIGMDECQRVGWSLGMEIHLSPFILETYFSGVCFKFLYSVAWVYILASEH